MNWYELPLFIVICVILGFVGSKFSKTISSYFHKILDYFKDEKYE